MRLLHPSTWFHPITRKRLMRFRRLRRAWGSFWLLTALFLFSLAAELVCNDRPLAVRHDGRWVFPVFRFYPEDRFTGSGKMTRTDYRALARSDRFAPATSNRMIWPLIPYGPMEILTARELTIPHEVTLSFAPRPRVAALALGPELAVCATQGDGPWLGLPASANPAAAPTLETLLDPPPALRDALRARFENRRAEGWDEMIRLRDGREVRLTLVPFAPRPAPPVAVRLTFREPPDAVRRQGTLVFGPDAEPLRGDLAWWNEGVPKEREAMQARVRERFAAPVAPYIGQRGDRAYEAAFKYEDFRTPFRPTRGHPMGLDGSGRDVLARIVYGLRTALSFGLLLVFASMALGTFVGAVQGYYGGWVDLAGQRTIEIWQALPFLYVMILLGSIYGQSFLLLLVIYGLFNWIGISYYMRGEFLRLRHLPFVEAAKTMDLPTRKILFRHMLPNALVPLITFFPFSLVGAIGSLAALDYLGFGLPPPTPSWGELLSQGHEFNGAWWLTLYPTLALFLVMLLGVFIGEGVRSAFDPKQSMRME